jgi:hypothetical protein
MIKLIDILKEGAYDSMTRNIVKTIINDWKSQYTGDQGILELDDNFELTDAKGREFDIDINAILKVKQTVSQKYIVDGGVDQLEEPPYMEIRFQVDPRDLPQKWEDIYFDLTDVVRHEIEHLTQQGANVIPSKAMNNDDIMRNLINMKLAPKSEYFKLEKEVDAMLQGMYLKAKKTRTPFKDVINDYFNKVKLNKQDRQDILDLWSTRLKALNLPPIQ